MALTVSIVEDAALEWFGELGYAVAHGPHLAPGEPAAERESFSEVVLVERLREAIGVLERQRLLDLLQHFIVFEEDPDSGALHKIIAGYHQFHAVNSAVEETVRASGMLEETRIEEGSVVGVSWARRMHGGQPGDRRQGE